MPKVTRGELLEAYHNAPARPADGGSQHTGVEAVALLIAERLGASIEIVRSLDGEG